jgi:MFS family permease
LKFADAKSAQMTSVEQGLKKNWKAFSLLVLINAFVGGMVGLERSIFPQYAEKIFGITSHAAVLSFIMAFGLSKAIANYFTGKWAQHLGRKKLLLLGWTIALPIPFMLIYTTSWNVVLLANILLGISQGLTWSSTVIMKIDLVGEKNRGLAMGLNEFAGYAAVGIMAWISGWVAFEWGIVPYPFYLGILISVAGWLLTWLWVKDTAAFVKKESQLSKIGVLKNPFSSVTWRHRTLSAVNQAGWVNNLNDGMMWGLFPILLFDLNYNLQEIGFLAAAYPTAWGVGQLFTGKMADHISTKKMLVGGMSLQGIAIIALTMVDKFGPILSCAILLGVGTALVYPTFITVIAQHSHPEQRAETVGIFRLWRDLGYVFGALISGAIADHWGILPAIFFIGVITLISGWVVQLRMNN